MSYHYENTYTPSFLDAIKDPGFPYEMYVLTPSISHLKDVSFDTIEIDAPSTLHVESRYGHLHTLHLGGPSGLMIGAVVPTGNTLYGVSQFLVFKRKNSVSFTVSGMVDDHHIPEIYRTDLVELVDVNIDALESEIHQISTTIAELMASDSASPEQILDLTSTINTLASERVKKEQELSDKTNLRDANADVIKDLEAQYQDYLNSQIRPPVEDQDRDDVPSDPSAEIPTPPRVPDGSSIDNSTLTFAIIGVVLLATLLRR